MSQPGRVAPVRLLAHLTILAFLAGTSCARPEPTKWQRVEVPTDADFVGAWFADSLNGWLTGGNWNIDGGIVGRTRDGGRTWTFETGVIPGRPSRAGLGHVQFRDSLHGWTGGGDVLLTDDGGATWRPARFTGGSAAFDIQLIDDRTGWAVGSGAILTTQDGGETWRELVQPSPMSPSAVHFVDASRGWLISHIEGLMRSRDGGVTWTRVELPFREGERPTLRDVTFVGDEQGWVVGERGSIFHTADGGTTWTLQEAGVPVVRVLPKGEKPRRDVLPELEIEPDRLALFAVAFADASRGWTVGYYADVAESVVLGTHDGGATWEVEHVEPAQLLRALFALDANHAWAAGDRPRTSPQVILRSAPGGR